MLVIDDCCLYREGLVSILDKQPDAGVIKASYDRGSTERHLAGWQPDIVLVNLDSRDSAQLIALVRERSPSSLIIAIGVAESDQDIVACAEAGVAGFLLRSEPFHHLMMLVRVVVAGDTLCSPRATAALMRRLAQLADEGPAEGRVPQQRQVPVLTRREDQILGYLEAGMSNQGIAELLGISLRTVKNHVHHLLTKLGVSRRGEAVAVMRSSRGAGPAALATLGEFAPGRVPVPTRPKNESIAPFPKQARAFTLSR
jgi:DNA-binding NarL/FixJ family response regulator